MERYGRFEILGRIGRGGMAEILLARERSLAGGMRHLVIKRVLPEIAHSDEMLHMFLDEARVVMGLSHPHLCQIYEVGEQEGAWFIAMEWVNGVTLHSLIRRAFSSSDVDYAILARVIGSCAEALHHAHTARDGDGRALHLVHRDVSPHNIMMGYDGRVKLLDFGIAKSIKSTHQTEAGVVKGKVCYMAPEQWLSGPLDARTDVFALGACLYEGLTGRVLFRRETQSEVMRAVLKQEIPPLSEVAPDVPAALAAVVHRALSFQPEDRFQTALEMSEALEQYLASRSEPLAASRIAGYVRRLFRAEVELGPMLERQVRGAHLAASPVVLPPLPAALLGAGMLPPSLLGFPAAEAVTGLDVSALRSDAEPSALPPPLSVPGVSLGPVTAPTLVDASAPSPPRLETLAESDLTQSAERSLSAAPATSADSLLARGSRRFDAPLKRSLTPSGEARQAARTISMRARPSLRRVALLALSGALGLLTVLYGLSPSALRSRAEPRASTYVPAHTVRAPEAAGAVATTREPPAAALAPRLNPALPALAALPERAEAALETSRETPVRPSPGKLGKLSINTRPWSTVYLGHRVLGTTPLADVSVPRTALLLKLVDRDGKVHMRRVARSAKAERSAFYDFAQPAKRTSRSAPAARAR